ncbi:hypothetical protein PWT90_06519 [Aphanocladium album]|nr:hypothetical protein PWT90_06519 [Aphanocladium album]
MDPVSITCAVITVGGFALTSAVQLRKLVHGLQDQNRRTRALQNELTALGLVLESLIDTISASEPDAAFGTLKDPLQQCGEACNSYNRLLADKLTKHTTSARPSIRVWFNQQRYWGDVTEFREMISAYKATISIAIANINIRLTTSIKKEALDDYKHMMSDTTEDLKEHLSEINRRIGGLAYSGPQNEELNSAEWRDLLAEKRCAQQGLEFCAQVSSEIERLEPCLHGFGEETKAPIAQKYWKNGVDDTKGSIQAMESKLRSHKEEIEREMQGMSYYQTHIAAELEDLQKSKDGMEKCLQVVAQAEEQVNVFENINLSENSVNFTISTVGKVVKTRNLTASGGSFNFGGQVGSAELAVLLEGLGFPRSPAYGQTSATREDTDVSSVGLSRPKRTQNLGSTLEQRAEVPQVTATNEKMSKD